jgi:hypothetical protein
LTGGILNVRSWALTSSEGAARIKSTKAKAAFLRGNKPSLTTESADSANSVRQCDDA